MMLRRRCISLPVLLVVIFVTWTNRREKDDRFNVLVDAAAPSIVTQVRRMLNFGSIFGSATTTSRDGYDRIMGQPVFQVTTGYGAPYMNMELKAGLREADDGRGSGNNLNGIQQVPLSQDKSEYRQIFLYYMDPDDAMAAHAEFKQMDQMKNTDIRISCSSLGKALNSAANLGSGGMLTGQPINPLNGRVLPASEGGSLRHKILPPKKQLFYAARCYGKERIGFFSTGNEASENPLEDRSAGEAAKDALIGNKGLASRMARRRQAKLDRKFGSDQPKNSLEAQYMHMDTQIGIPVFYARGMERRLPFLKALISGNARETPLFFNYEDLQDAWKKSRVAQQKGKKTALPEDPEVEVFNLVDILTSMEKNQARKAKTQSSNVAERVVTHVSEPFKRRFVPLFTSQRNAPLGLESITFVPSSDACQYKEQVTARGNSKARLRRMQEFGTPFR